MQEREGEFGNYDTTLEWLDASMTEPAALRAIGLARMYNELLAEEDITKSDAKQILKHLDSEWDHLNDAPVRIWGTVTVPTTSDETQDLFVDDAAFISKGFDIVPIETAGMLKRHKIVHHLQYMGTEQMRRETGYAGYLCAADIDKVIISSKVGSYERAIAWLMVTRPDLLEYLQDTLRSHDGNAPEVIMALKDYEFPLQTEDEESARASVKEYFTRHLALDRQTPYGLTLDGAVFRYTWREGKPAFIPMHMKGKMMASIKNIFPVRSNTDTFVLGLSVEQIGRDITARPPEVLVPFGSVESVVSIRDAYYAS